MQKPKLNNKGMGIIDLIIMAPLVFIVLYIAFTLMDTIQENFLFPIVANLSGGYSTIIRVILELVPLILVMLFLVIIVQAARGQSGGYSPGI